MDTIIQQQIPVYLQISYPAGAICLSVSTSHPASMGRASRVSSVLGLLFHTWCCAWAFAQLPAAAGWMGTAPRQASGQTSAHQHCVHGISALTDLPCPGPKAPLNLGEASKTWLLTNIRPGCLTNSKTHPTHTHTHKMHKLGMTWVQLVLN